jgi:hypothetical protein
MKTFVAKYKLGDWFNDIQGAIDFLSRDADFSSLSSWASLTDGGILEAIQNGMHAYSSGNMGGGMGLLGMAADAWAGFFSTYYGEFEAQERRGNISDELLDRIIAQRLGAEQAGANYGYNIAQGRYDQSHRRLQIKIDLFKWGADEYRRQVPDSRRANRALGIPNEYFSAELDPRTAGPVLVARGRNLDDFANLAYAFEVTRFWGLPWGDFPGIAP